MLMVGSRRNYKRCGRGYGRYEYGANEKPCSTSVEEKGFTERTEVVPAGFSYGYKRIVLIAETQLCGIVELETVGDIMGHL